MEKVKIEIERGQQNVTKEQIRGLIMWNEKYSIDMGGKGLGFMQEEDWKTKEGSIERKGRNKEGRLQTKEMLRLL